MHHTVRHTQSPLITTDVATHSSTGKVRENKKTLLHATLMITHEWFAAAWLDILPGSCHCHPKYHTPFVADKQRGL